MRYILVHYNNFRPSFPLSKRLSILCLFVSLSTLGKIRGFFYDRKRFRRTGLLSTEVAPSQGGARWCDMGKSEICWVYGFSLSEIFPINFRLVGSPQQFWRYTDIPAYPVFKWPPYTFIGRQASLTFLLEEQCLAGWPW